MLEGEIEFSSGDQVVTLKAGEVVVFAPYETHMVRNVRATMARNTGVLAPPRHGDSK